MGSSAENQADVDHRGAIEIQPASVAADLVRVPFSSPLSFFLFFLFFLPPSFWRISPARWSLLNLNRVKRGDALKMKGEHM